jgi:hypothetical protein
VHAHADAHVASAAAQQVDKVTIYKKICIHKCKNMGMSMYTYIDHIYYGNYRFYLSLL